MTLLNPRQVAGILGISDRTVHQLCREGKLGYFQVDSKHRRFTQENIDEYLRSVSVRTRSSKKAVPPVSQPVKISQEFHKPVDRNSLREEMDKW